MAEILKPALIGIPSLDLFAWLKDVLDQDFGVDAVQVKTFDELKSLVDQSNRSREDAEKFNKAKETPAANDWSLIIIASNLPPIHTRKATPERVKTYFTSLDDVNKWGDFITVLIVGQDEPLDWRGITPPARIIHLSDPPKPDERQTIVGELDGLGDMVHVSSAEFKLAWDKENRILREQIRSLSDLRNLTEGEGHLARLISRCLDSSTADEVEIKHLGQGKSGARVFRLCVTTKNLKRKEFVLKLCQAAEVWKLESEVGNHLRASKGLGHPGYREHIPELKKAHLPSGGLEHLGGIKQPNRHIVRSGHWYAVHYDFLGGDAFGEFVDLETALTASAKELEKKIAGVELAGAAKATNAHTVRAGILEIILEWLCENWYANMQTGNVERKEMTVWDLGDAPEQKYIIMPPYQLTGRTKGWILSFLDSPEAEMGVRFFNDWEKHATKVLRLVTEDELQNGLFGELSKPLPVVLSHVHGDLNANNILVWMKHKHPFLIDFPFYQEAGHALQDFARLEVEVKFALLDRQKESPENSLKAFEYTYSQVPIWQEMENHLLDQWDQDVSRWTSKGYPRNVQSCYALVQLIRRAARRIQQNVKCTGPPAGDFLSEYWPALLYHTLRAISYTPSSVFKRLLAVYSAGSILTKLNCFPNQ